ncbi:hypothetical protein KRMM14A1004_09800 [Krasilnikovia sp. MM14-A1004]
MRWGGVLWIIIGILTTEGDRASTTKSSMPKTTATPDGWSNTAIARKIVVTEGAAETRASATLPELFRRTR